MDVVIRENERIDDLERNGYRIIQNSRRFCFGMDAVLLSGFVCEGETGSAWHNNSGAATRPVPENIRIADLGTGTGIIPILLHGKLGIKNRKPEGDYGAAIKALEIQPEVHEMACRSVMLNDLQEDIEVVLGDIKEASALMGKGKFDVVTSNPPYMKHAKGLTNPDQSKAISRHELMCTFDDVAREAAALLKSGGRFYLVHRPERLAELICTLKEYRLEPKRIRLVHSFADTEATMVLIEAARGGKPFMKVEKPLIIYKEKGVYTEEILQIYNF
ncbi:MAG: tRNA1(Val) (adenine(37)-N6)-methyltransferase [Parasporobacterium sp.]|nr:tRNA1(Val) (adenine(37)-N6)-methyltransferase [Parasporobacterium sp.]